MHNYLIVSDNKLLINDKVKELIKEKNFHDATISKYEVEENFLDKILEELDTYSLFSTKKIVILNDIDNLSNIEIDNLKEKIKLLYKYLDNPSNDNMFIITLKSIPQSNFYKKIKEKMTLIKIETDINKIVKERLKGYKISKDNLQYLIDLCDNDIYKLTNECNKLIDYCIDNKEITKEDINLLVIKKIKETKFLAFDFTRSLLEKDRNKALEEYKKLLEEGNDTLKIIGLIASNLRTLLIIKTMENDGYRRNDIAKKLNKKTFYVQKQQELTRLYSTKDIINCIKKLEDIDLKCKSTDLDNKLLLEMYIINM